MADAVQVFKVGPKEIRSVVELLKKEFEINEIRTFKLLESHIESERHLLLMAKVGSEPAGVIECSVTRYNILTGGVDRGVVHTIYVEPNHRRLGVGRSLLQAASFWFSGTDIDWVVCDVGIEDEDLKEFLKNQSFEPYNVKYIKRVEKLD